MRHIITYYFDILLTSLVLQLLQKGKNLITEVRDDYHLVLEILIYTSILVGSTDRF